MLFSLCCCCCCCCCCYVADSIRSTLFLLIIYILKLGGLFRRYVCFSTRHNNIHLTIKAGKNNKICKTQRAMHL